MTFRFVISPDCTQTNHQKMDLIKWPSQQDPPSIQNGPKIMELSDSTSTTSTSPQPSSSKGTRRGRPRLTEDAELAKQVPCPSTSELTSETTRAITGCTTWSERTKKQTFRRTGTAGCTIGVGEFNSQE
jgi:hypothetical protein